MIWRAGPDKLCDFFNKPWLDFTGRTLEQEIGNGWTEGVHPDDYQRCLATYQGAFDDRREFPWTIACAGTTANTAGSLDNGRPFYGADGDFAGYFGSCIDITERKVAEERLQATLREQSKILREKDALTAEVHHRVRNNLQVMLGLVGLSMRHTPDPACHAVLQSFADRIQALAIVQTHLHEADNVSQIDLRTVCQGTRRCAGPALPWRQREDHHLRRSLPAAAPRREHGRSDPGRAAGEQLQARIRRRPDGDDQHPGGAQADGAARLAVADDGPGFNPENGGRPRGGIGLTLVRTYAGQIGAMSQRSSDGTRFEIALPAHRTTEESGVGPGFCPKTAKLGSRLCGRGRVGSARDVASRRPAGATWKQVLRRTAKRILVAEDEALISVILSGDLRDEGYVIAGPFSTARDALAWLADDTPDLAIVDYMLRDGPCTMLRARCAIAACRS